MVIITMSIITVLSPTTIPVITAEPLQSSVRTIPGVTKRNQMLCLLPGAHDGPQGTHSPGAGRLGQQTITVE